MQDETDGTPAGGKIAQRAGISALDVRRCGPTRRARSRWRYRPQRQCDLLSHLDLLDLDLGNVWKDDDTVQWMPRRKGKLEKMFNFSVYHLLDQQTCVRSGYIADIPDLFACSAFGKTPEEALRQVQIAKATWIEAALAESIPVPPPKYKPVLYQAAS
jgi:predicted RNase H-like HicB family nuclease